MSRPALRPGVEPPSGFLLHRLILNGVARVDALCLVADDAHGRAARHSSPLKVADGRSSEVMQVAAGHAGSTTSGPADTELVPTSRTVGADQVVDEMLFKFTHTSEIDWMLPGIKPTGRRVEIPVVAIVRFVDGKVAHEHIYWDQASVLVQVGWLDPAGLPVAGAETARKVADNTRPSNKLMTRWAASAGKPI